jgi:hypothetical protein
VARESPAGTCLEVSFGGTYRIGDAGQVALEDYARALTRAEAAEAVSAPGDPGHLSGVHLCAPAAPPREAVLAELEAFARNLAHRPGDGLGWS